MLEAVILFPALIAILMLIAYASRLGATHNEVLAAARAGARAASQAHNPGAAAARTEEVVLDSLAEGSLRCGDAPDILIDTGQWASGGAVTVTVACDIDLDDLGLIGLGGVKTVRASSTAAIDSYREL